MSNEVELVVALWELVRDYLPAAKRPEIATDILRAFEGYGFDDKELYGVEEEDRDLARAYEEVFGEGDDDEGWDED